MTGPDYRDPRLTEQRNPRTERIDVASALEIVDLLNAEVATVAPPLRRSRPPECGGRDRRRGGACGAWRRGPRHRPRGRCVRPRVLVDTCDVLILPKVGPEALTGSTRMKAGTATKLVLNTVSTGAMIRLGRAYGNLMVDLMALSDKLRDRGERIVMECAGVDRGAARRAIEAAGGSVKLAIVMMRRAVGKTEAVRLLADADGFVRRAAGDPPPVRPGWRRSPSGGCRAPRLTGAP